MTIIENVTFYKASNMKEPYGLLGGQYNLEINDSGKARVHTTSPYTDKTRSRFNQLNCIGKTNFYHYCLKVEGKMAYFKSNVKIH